MSGKDVRRPRFGEADRELSYGSYLRIPELLALQTLQSDPPAHDELLFIVVHQAYELWFKQLIFELESVRDRMFEGDAWRARHYLTRIHAIERVLIEHIEVLETMSPQDFLEFRSLLSPASGFQSAQFREVEFLSGLKQRGYLNDLRLYVWVVDVASGEKRRISSDAVDHMAPRWSPDGTQIGAQRFTLNGMASQLAIFDVASGAQTIVGPEQAVSLTEALKAVTINAAGQIGMADRIGSLEAGKEADVTILETENRIAEAKP